MGITGSQYEEFIPFAFRVSVLPFTTSLWFEGRFGFAIALSLIWHFVVYVPWKSLPDFEDALARQNYFLVMPLIAIAFAIVGYLARILLHLPFYLTPANYLYDQLWRTRCTPQKDDDDGEADDDDRPQLPPSYPIVSLCVSLLVVLASWLPTELLVVVGGFAANSPEVFYTSLTVPLGATFLPLILWLAYGHELWRLFGTKFEIRNKFKTFIKVLLVTALVNIPYALIVNYTQHFNWLWITAIISIGGILIGTVTYYVLVAKREPILYRPAPRL